MITSTLTNARGLDRVLTDAAVVVKPPAMRFPGRAGAPVCFRLVLLAMVSVLASTACAQITFRSFRPEPGDFPYRSIAPTAISADGRVVVGYTTYMGQEEAFRWTASEGITHLGKLPALPGHGVDDSRATAVSGDGSVIVGISNASAFRWTAAEGLMPVRRPDQSDWLGAGVFGISADGQVIAGIGPINPGDRVTGSFVLTGTGAVTPIGQGDATSVSGISHDGATVIGFTSAFGGQAFRWTEQDGLVALGSMVDSNNYPNGDSFSGARAVSSDGSVVVGLGTSATSPTQPVQDPWETPAPPVEAFRWTPDRGMVGLGYIGDGMYYSVANAVSGDGRIVVGGSNAGPDAGSGAFVWDEANGMRSLVEILSEAGIDMDGWELSAALAISADGKTIVGFGRNLSASPYLEEVWIVDGYDPFATFQPVPESSTYVFIGTFGLTILFMKRFGRPRRETR